MDLTIGKRGDFTAANHDHEQMNGETPAACTQPLIDHLVATRATSAGEFDVFEMLSGGLDWNA